MQIHQGEENTILIPENWLEEFQLNKPSKIHCRVCGLEGCGLEKHSIKSDPFEMGEEDMREL